MYGHPRYKTLYWIKILEPIDETNNLVYFQKSLENAENGGDVDTVQSLAEEHEQFHREVLSFRKEVDRCIADGVRGPVDICLHLC